LIITPGNPVVDYDPDGLAFGIGIDSQIIGLYDIRNHEKVGIVFFLFHFFSIELFLLRDLMKC
jgi:hypothetical protein